MSDFPKDGSTFVVEAIDRTAYRWAKYKPDGARQMGKPGRWQKQVWSGDYFKWENCEDPVGELSPPVEDGPISKAFKRAGALEHWRQEVGKLHSQIAAKDAEIARLRNKVPARALTDAQLSDEIAAVDAACSGGFGEGGGSPGEWWYERADELEHERKRREIEAQLVAHNAAALKEKADA